MNPFIAFIINHWALWLALVVILVLIAGLEFQSTLRGIPTLSPSQTTNAINHEEAKLLDIREENLYQQGHITEAIHFPAAQINEAANRLKNQLNHPIIVVDQTGQNALNAALALRKQGFTKVSILQGGITGWTQAGLPLVTK